MQRIKRLKDINSFDVFAAFNTFLFFAMVVFVYYDRFLSFRGRENLWEFFVYATVIFLVILIFWYSLRRFKFRWYLLVAIEIGLLMHFAGGLIHYEGLRLYSHEFFGIRFDKYVHFVNACAITLLVNALVFVPLKSAIKDRVLGSVIVIMTVLGLGAVVEIVEYLVTLTVTVNGVGGYDNNMQDLMANLLGTFVTVIILQNHQSRINGKEQSDGRLDLEGKAAYSHVSQPNHPRSDQ